MLLRTKARKFALKHHGEQKYGEYPYSIHLDAVAELVRQYGETAVVIAYLHDVVEDTAVTLAEVENAFGTLVADCVTILTDEPGKDRQERKEKTYRKMAHVRGEAEIALLVKAADRLANMRACIADNKERLLTIYRKEHPFFQKAARRLGLCDELWDQLDELFKGEPGSIDDVGMQE